MKRYLLGLCITTMASSVLYGQATSTASRQFDLQAGAGVVLDKSDYYPKIAKGGAFYATLDLTYHWGAEIDFRQANETGTPSYERTYEAGARYHRTYGRFAPYAKGLYGRGVFNFVAGNTVVANLAYNEFALGAGTDYHLLPWLNLRADYEYQHWFSFPPNGLTPQVLTLGVAYHLPGGLKRGNRYR